MARSVIKLSAIAQKLTKSLPPKRKVFSTDKPHMYVQSLDFGQGAKNITTAVVQTFQAIRPLEDGFMRDVWVRSSLY